MSENLQKLQQRHAEISFIVKHHEELTKAYLREVLLLEQAIQREQNTIQQSEEIKDDNSEA